MAGSLLLLGAYFLRRRFTESKKGYEKMIPGESKSSSMSCNPCAFCLDVICEFSLSKMTLGVLPSERSWREQYGESALWSNRLFNVALKCLLVAIGLYAQYLSTFNWGPNFKFYGIYLTYWTLTVQNLYHLSNLGMAMQALVRSEPLRGTVEVTTALRAVAQPIALVVALSYWASVGLVDLSLQNLMVHAVNAVIIVLDAVTGKQSSRLLSCVWAYAFMLVYVAWTYVHFRLEMGTSHGGRAIYDCFDWHERAATWRNLVILFGTIMPAAVLLAWTLVWLRNQAIGGATVSEDLEKGQSHGKWWGRH